MLTGKIIINTRPEGSKDLIGQALKELGAEVLHMPLIEIEPIPIPRNIQANITKTDGCHWLVFTSRNGVEMFFNQLTSAFHFDALNIKTAVYGRRTAMALEEHGIKADLINLKNTSADLLEDLCPQIQKSDKVLLVLGDLASNLLEEGLKDKADVARLDVYKTVFVQKANESLMARIKNDNYDLILFTSPSGFKSFMHHSGNATNNPPVKIACLGPTTETAILDYGMAPLVVAKPSGKVGLIRGIEQLFTDGFETPKEEIN